MLCNYSRSAFLIILACYAVADSINIEDARYKLAWETEEEWRFREFARVMAPGKPCTWFEPSCTTQTQVSCALAAPCAAMPFTRPDGAYERSVAFWRTLTAAAEWSEGTKLTSIYAVHPQLKERQVDCPHRKGTRRMPSLTLKQGAEFSAGEFNSSRAAPLVSATLLFSPKRKDPSTLRSELKSLGLRRVVLIGDSLTRYIFISIVGTYCSGRSGQLLDAECKLDRKGKLRSLTVTDKSNGDATEPLIYSIGYIDCATSMEVKQLLQNVPAEEVFFAYRVTASYKGPLANSNVLGSPAIKFFDKLKKAGARRLALISPTPCGFTGMSEYNPLGDRNEGPQHTFEMHRGACEHGLPVVDLWPLEMSCASQSRAVNHRNLHYCLPGVPDIEWQLLLHFIKKANPRADKEDRQCTCPHLDQRALLTCANQDRWCTVDADHELHARFKVVNSKLRVASERRTKDQMAALCLAANNSFDLTCPQDVLLDPHLVKSTNQTQRSCIIIEDCAP